MKKVKTISVIFILLFLTILFRIVSWFYLSQPNHRNNKTDAPSTTTPNTSAPPAKTSLTNSEESLTPEQTTTPTPSQTTIILPVSSSPQLPLPILPDTQLGAAPAQTPAIAPAARQGTSLSNLSNLSIPSNPPAGALAARFDAQTAQIALSPKISPQLPPTSAQPLPSLKTALEKLTPVPVVTHGCYEATYFHKKLASHEDGEGCLSHKNQIKLSLPGQTKAPQLNSICIKVNNTPTAFSRPNKKENTFIIDPIAGPSAKITLRYCIGKTQCKEKCDVKKDNFLDALGADDSESQSNVGWTGSKSQSKEDRDTEKAMKQLNKDESNSGITIFSDWIEEKKSPTCGTHSNL